MELLALLIALALFGLWGSGGVVQQDGWFHGLRGSLAQWLGGSALQLALVLLPTVGVLLLATWLGGALFGLPSLVLLTVVLLWSFGRGNLGAALAEYLERWSRGDFQAAFRDLQHGEAGPAVSDPGALHALARQQLYYRGFERTFAVLFWFLLAGPAGAVAYRLAALEREQVLPQPSGTETVGAAEGDAQPAAPAAADGRLPLHFWLDWIPARLLGISYALVADFDACLYRWRAALADRAKEAPQVLEECGNAALHIGDTAEGETTEALVARGAAELDAVAVLHRRALVVWLVVIALLSMIG